jgi:AAA domain
LGKARSVRVMQAAVTRPKSDVTDHFAAGYSIDDLVPINGAFKPVSLGNLVSTGVKPPEFIGPEQLLYRGGLHCIAGAPDCGKTTLALYWAVSLLAAGHRVAFFDEEGGQEIIAEKLISLGALPQDMNNLIYVPFPGKVWDDSDVEALLEFLSENRPDFALWDSSAAFLARAGLDENSAPAVTNWWSRVLMPIARDLNAAVLVIDHDTKSSESSRYARGSGAKLAVLDVQFKVEIVTPFSRVQTGELKFHVSKDRRGWLYRDWRVKIDTADKILNPQFIKASCDQETWNSWSTTKQDVYAALPVGRWMSIKQVIDSSTKTCGRTHARETVTKMLGELRDEGFVEQQETGQGTTSWWRRT